MRSIGQFQAGNYKASGKSRVMWFPSVAAARAEPRLFELADAIEIDGQSLFYADRLSTVVDDGTSNTPAIKLDAVQLGRFVRAQPYLPSGVCFAAAEDGTDDWPRLTALVNTEYGPGGLRRKILLRNGTYRMVQHSEWPIENLKIHAEGPGVHIVCDVPSPSTAIPHRGPFAFAGTLVTPQPVATLSQQYGRGSDVLSVITTTAAVPQVGQILGLVSVDGAMGAEYAEIKSVTGSGPYIVRLSHALKYTHTVANTTLIFRQAMRNCEFIGNGARMSGATDRFISCPMSIGCKISGWDLDGNEAAEYLCSIDGGSENGSISNMVVRNVRTIGCCLEYGFNNTLRDCSGDAAPDGAGALFGSWGDNDHLENLAGNGSSVTGSAGLILGNVFYPGKGWNENVTVSNVTMTNCSSGISGQDVRGLIVDGAKLSGGKAGLNIGGDSACRMTATFRRVASTGSTEGAYVIYDNADIVFEDCDFGVGTGGSGFVGRLQTATCKATHVRGTVTNGTAGQVSLQVTSGGTLNLDATIVDASAGPAFTQPVTNIGGTVNAKNVGFICSANTLYCYVGGTGSVARLNGCRIISGTPSVGIRVDNATAYVWIGDDNDFGAATAYYSGAGKVNMGETALNGATPVSLPFPPTTAKSRVRLDRKTVGGTASPNLTWGVAAGTGGTMVSAAGDTSVVAWKIYES